jgi:hypothetical protein
MVLRLRVIHCAHQICICEKMKAGEVLGSAGIEGERERYQSAASNSSLGRPGQERIRVPGRQHSLVNFLKW